MFHKKECSSKFCKIHKKTPASEPLVKFPGRGKKNRVQYQVFSCEFCKIFKSIYLQNIHRRLLVKKNDQRRDPHGYCLYYVSNIWPEIWMTFKSDLWQRNSNPNTGDHGKDWATDLRNYIQNVRQ